MREFKDRHPALLRENYTASQLIGIFMRCRELERAFSQIMIEVKEPVKHPADGQTFNFAWGMERRISGFHRHFNYINHRRKQK
jgi:hypothetical protein